MHDPQQLRYRNILRFWFPLAATWLMMAAEGPFLAAVIARLAEPKYNLAAHGVAFSFAVLIEAPVIMMMSASTALVDSATSLRRLRKFSNILNVLVTFMMLFFLIPSVYDFVTGDLIELDPEVARLTHRALLILLPWPGMIGYRRFYQGLLIRAGLTRRVAYGTVVRLSSMTATGFLLYFLADLPGCWIGAWAMTVGVCLEALASRVMVHDVLDELNGTVKDMPPEKELSYGGIMNFYTPLALTSIISIGVHPMVTFFMGKAAFPLESLAVLPVLGSLVFVFRTAGISYQEAAITLLSRSNKNLGKVARFAGLVALGSSTLLALLAWTPLAEVWLIKVSGLSRELADFALLPLRIAVIMPALEAILAFQRSLQVNARRTLFITLATVSEVTGLLLGLAFAIKGMHLVGATAAMLSFVFGRLLGNLTLLAPCLKTLGRIRAQETASESR